MFGPAKKHLTPLGRHGAVHKVAGKGHAPFQSSGGPGNDYTKTAPAMQAPMAAHANPLPPAPPPAPMPAPPMAAPAAPSPDDTSLASQSAGI